MSVASDKNDEAELDDQGGAAMTDGNRKYGELIALNRQDKKLLDFSVFQESPDYTETIAYSPAVFSQVSLPYQNPGDQPQWVRHNGPLTMRINPLVIMDDETGEVKERRYPFGMFPRLMVTFLTTEARRRNSRVVPLGGNLTEFMRTLGIKHTGPAGERTRRHITTFFNSTIKFEGYVSNAAGEGTKNLNFTFATAWNEWTPRSGMTHDVGPKPAWENEVQLSEQFFDDVSSRGVPLDLNALRALGNSPLRIDIYSWLAHRMSYLREKTFVSWEDLDQQFGASYKEIRQFRGAFREHLAMVYKVYPGLRVDADSNDYLVLYPSRTPIAKRPAGAKPAKIQFAGDRLAIGE